MVIQVYAPTSNAEEVEFEWFYGRGMKIQREHTLVCDHRVNTWQDGTLDSMMCFTSSVHMTAITGQVIQRVNLPSTLPHPQKPK